MSDGPIVINASDIEKVFGKKHHRYGEHGSVEDPDLFHPVSVGVTRLAPKYTVKADPDGATLNTASTRSEPQVDELDELILALTEARDWLQEHEK